MLMQRWKNRHAASSKIARYLFFAGVIAFLAAFALVYFEPPHTVEVVSDVFHPEYGSQIITPLTTVEKIALWIALLGFGALLSAVVALLWSIFHYRPVETPTV
jgi:hypothetical protein